MAPCAALQATTSVEAAATIFATVSVSTREAVATSAAAETQGMFLQGPVFGPVRGFCRLTTILPIVAFAVPVLVTVIRPFTVKKLLVVTPRVAVTVHVIPEGSSGKIRLCSGGFFVSVQAVSFA